MGKRSVNSAEVDRLPQRAFRLIVTGGGTGGHTYPALTAVRTLAARLTTQGRALEVLWAGKADSLESRVAAAEGIVFASVATGKIRRSKNPLKMISPANVADMSRVPLGVLQARKIISGFRPDVVLATGGYVAVPVGVAATRLCHVPLVVHEQTVRLGLANKTLMRRSDPCSRLVGVHPAAPAGIGASVGGRDGQPCPAGGVHRAGGESGRGIEVGRLRP